MLDFIILHGTLFGNDLPKQRSQLGDVPFPVPQLVNRFAKDIIDIELECRAKGAARGNDLQAQVENQQRFAQSVDNTLGDRSGRSDLNEMGWSPRSVGDRQRRRLSLWDHIYVLCCAVTTTAFAARRPNPLPNVVFRGAV